MNNNIYLLGIEPLEANDGQSRNDDVFTVFDYPIDSNPNDNVSNTPVTATGNTPQTVTPVNTNPVDNDNTEPQVINKDGRKSLTIGNQTLVVNTDTPETLDAKVRKFIEENPMIALGGLALVIYLVFIKD